MPRTRIVAALLGVAFCDVKTGQIRSLMWAFEGLFRGIPPYDSPGHVVAAVEWRAEPGGE